MEHQNEYHDSMVAMLELVWGEGFMAPGGIFSCYDWMKSEGAYSEDMQYEFPRLLELVGEAAAAHAVENWRAAVVVCEKGEMLQVYSRARSSA
jgi:hypothetical protein